MNTSAKPRFPTRAGYMTEKIRADYITAAIRKGEMPKEAHRLAEIVSLEAPADTSRPIQFWQLYSVLGQDPIVEIVARFYDQVFADEPWFTSVFQKVGGVEHHIQTQASMWIDVMGGGPYYHGAEFRLSFHHMHNAHQLMTDKGAERWSALMLKTLDEAGPLLVDDARIRPSLNTFLSHFMGKYAAEFSFENRSAFGPTNPAFKRKINFMKMTTEAIRALSEEELFAALEEHGVDASEYIGKENMVNKALML